MLLIDIIFFHSQVLLTSSDAILANLTPALVAEANLLRERFAHRYHNRTLFGMYPRSRRGESSRRSEGVGSSLDRAGGSIVSRRSLTSKVVEADGAPLVSTEGLLAMIRLLRIVQVFMTLLILLFSIVICAFRLIFWGDKFCSHCTRAHFRDFY